VEDPVNLDEEGVDDIVADQLEIRMRGQVADVVLTAAEEVIDSDDVVSPAEKVLAEMAP